MKSFLGVIQSQAVNEDKSQQGLYKITKGECTSEQALFPVSQLWICTFPMHLGLHSFKVKISNHLYDLMIQDTYKHMKERWQQKGPETFFWQSSPSEYFIRWVSWLNQAPALILSCFCFNLQNFFLYEQLTFHKKFKFIYLFKIFSPSQPNPTKFNSVSN